MKKSIIIIIIILLTGLSLWASNAFIPHGVISNQVVGTPAGGWTTPVAIQTIGDTIVLTEGTLVAASSGDVVDRTVNGVLFPGAAGAVGDFVNHFDNALVYQQGGIGAAFEGMMDSFVWNTGSPLGVTYTGLTIGNDYVVQVFHADDRPGSEGKIQTWDVAGFTSDAILLTSFHETHCYFTAASTSVTLTVNVTGTGSANGSMNASQIRAL